MGMLRSIRRGVTWVAVGVAGGAAVVTVRHLLRTPQPLESVLRGETHIDRKHGGDIFYNVAGPAGAPALLLLHDFYPGASNFEFRAIFEPLARGARVYAPDWLGFGMSERPNLAYTGEFYASMLTGFLRDVVGRPATVIAHGLAANVAVRAASDAPQLFERLVLVAPAAQAGEGEEPTLGQTVAQTAHRFSLGLVPYALVSTRPALKRIAGGLAADEERVDHLYASAHQFGGHFAPLALLSGDLDLPIRNALPLLEPPLLLISGEHDPRRPREAMEDLAVLNPHADLDVIARAGELVFEDQPGAFVAAVTSWRGTPADRHVLDESALLPPNNDSAPKSSDAPTDDSAKARGQGEAGAPVEAEGDGDETLVGTPGYVVPGVSDMGLDGPAVVTMDGIANIALDASDMPADAGASPDAGAGEESVSGLLPEAGEAGPSDAVDDAVANIADADRALEARGETPTRPQRATHMQPASTQESAASAPELRTSAAARTNERARPARGAAAKGSESAPRAAPSGRASGSANAGRGNARNADSSKKVTSKNEGRPKRKQTGE